MINSLYDSLIRLDETDSTNAEALRRAADLSGDFAVTAEYQSAGRGRMGRSFASPKGSGLYISVLERRELSPELTARVAVSVAKAIESVCGLFCDIKWPNDIQYDGKKLCGILCERAPSVDAAAVVIGIGINLSQSEEDFADLKDIATSLRLCGKEVDKEALTKALLTELDLMLSGAGKDEYLSYYRAHSNCIEKSIYLISGNKKIPAYAAGISDDFELIVRLEDGSEKRISTGEISLRFRG